MSDAEEYVDRAEFYRVGEDEPAVSNEQPPERVKLIPVKVSWQCPECRNVNPVMAHRLAAHGDVEDVCQVCKRRVILGAVRADAHETVIALRKLLAAGRMAREELIFGGDWESARAQLDYGIEIAAATLKEKA